LEILLALLEHAGERVSKEQLVAHVWPDTTVEEANLRVHVSALRRALADGRDGNRYILTDAGRGYRFVAPITVLSDVGAADSPATKHRHNLPAMLTRLVGRADTVSMLMQQVPLQRFVTLVGSGGVGKTSVALAVAEALLPAYEDGAWLVDLASLADPRLVPNAVAAAVGQDLRADDLRSALIAALRDKHMLLVFDNCDHVIDATAALAVEILKDAPAVHILATSREPLNAEGEHVRRLQPLETPPSRTRLTAARAMAFPAVQLFVERAAARLPEFALSDADAPFLAEICAKLDGIPLAIEFAAGRVDAFGIRDLTERLDDRLRLLTMGRRTALARHQTMRAALDWSYEVLPEAERLVLQRLGIFAGRFPLEAASRVVRSDDVSRSDVADFIADLVAKSLVTADVSGAVALYRLLETTRVYAREKLRESGTLEQVARRHAEHYRDLLEGDAAGWGASPETINRNRYCIDDIRAALDWAFSPGGDPSIGVAITVAAVPLWMEMSLMAEARDRVERALLSIVPGRDRAREIQLHAALGTSLFFTAGRSGFAAVSRNLERAEEIDDVEYQLGALWRLWSYRAMGGEYRRALALAEGFRSTAARAGGPSDRAIGDRLIGLSFHYLGEQTKARHFLEAMLDGYDNGSSKSHIERFQVDQRVAALAPLAKVLWLLGLPDQAARASTDAVNEAQARDHPNSLCYALAVAACPVALLSGDLVAAERTVTTLVDQASRHHMDLWRSWGAGYRGALLGHQGDAVGGSELLSGSLRELREKRYFVPLLSLLGDQARILALAGHAAEGLGAIDQAIDRAHGTDEHWNLAELLRIKGEIVLRDGSSAPDAVAEDLFAQSLALARSQHARSWELRTATSLARLRRNQGRRQAGHDLLAAVYARFNEGMETLDLRTARLMLEEDQIAERSVW
jgi:predicted ATPase/DNA-binding winged helix-turn-helix (wHTH) protein